MEASPPKTAGPPPRSPPIPIPGRSGSGSPEIRAPTPARRTSGGRAQQPAQNHSSQPTSPESAAADLDAACCARGVRREVALAEHLGTIDPVEGRRLSAHLREVLAGLTPAQVRQLATRVRQGDDVGR